MSSSTRLVIRDAIASDIADCLALDHAYETEHVWKMTILPNNDGWQTIFRKERLPRPVESTYEVDEATLKLALPSENCFLVAEANSTDNSDILAYLTMRPDPVHRIALVQDIVVAPHARRHKLGTRLLTIARTWAREQHLRQLMIETQTKNFPAIAFCQYNGLQFCGFNDQYYRNQDIAIFFGQTLR